MNFARYHDTVAGLSAIAQKVLECVPIQTVQLSTANHC